MTLTMPDVNGGLKRFNAWWDIFILEAIKPVAILSMGLGTVAIFNLQGLAINPWFVAMWAIVQALSIDGLFFATWDRLFTQKLLWKNALAIVALMFIGIVLALIAIAINAVLGFQVLWAISDSQSAMAKLGISPELFTAIRAVLAVVVFVFISFVRARARANQETESANVSVKPRAKRTATSSATVTVTPAQPLALPQVAVSHSGTISANVGSKYELIKEAMSANANDGKLAISLQEIAKQSGAGYSTVRLYAPDIKKELGIE
jgi:hypothetical protein